jgi:hypothetical protein
VSLVGAGSRSQPVPVGGRQQIALVGDGQLMVDVAVGGHDASWLVDGPTIAPHIHKVK